MRDAGFYLIGLSVLVLGFAFGWELAGWVFG